MNLTLICIELMKEEIKKYGLEVLQRYPNDLLVHDRHMLVRALKPGSRMAWMVGHCHTHLVPLGLSTQENENVTYLTNLASEDRFYLIEATSGKEHVRLKEIDREGFKSLVHTPVPYEMESRSNFGEFWLLKNKVRVGHIHIDRAGDWEHRVYSATLTPTEATMALDRVAVELWANQSMVKMAGTLFAKTNYEWADVIRTPIAA